MTPADGFRAAVEHRDLAALSGLFMVRPQSAVHAVAEAVLTGLVADGLLPGLPDPNATL
jgi:hypothetical protein